MNRSESRATVVLLPVVMVIGLTAGLMLRPSVDVLIESDASSHEEATSAEDGHDDHEPEDEHEEHEDDHVPLSHQAYQNLKLTVSTIELSDHTQSLRMPGEITEFPGLSAHVVSAPVSGRVTKLHVSPGVSLAAGEPLFELEIIDDELMQAQLRLLELLTKQEIVASELARLAPLTSSGAVAGRQRLEREYEQREIKASINQTKQELGMRGLSSEQLDGIAQSKQVIAAITVCTPQLNLSPLQKRPDETSMAGWNSDTAYSSSQPAFNGDPSIEKLFVDTGATVTRGAQVCSLANHGLLLVCGHAFENEIDIVSRLIGQDTPVAIEFGIVGDGEFLEGLRVQHVAGHVDETSQSFHFYVPLQNDVVKTSKDAIGRRFCTWRHKVGQRVHVLVPTEKIRDQFVLPADAVVQEGPEAFVFREHIEASAEHVDEHADDHEDVFIEFEPVHVTIVARDKSVVVVAPGEELAIGDRVAMNSAYQLHLALKSQQEGGGGHHHHHH
jgi:multidrug efflux pump subunit AcrA (membrane-fusion protein)